MRYGHFTRCAGLLVAALLLASCGSGNNSGDVFPWAALTITPTSGPDSFLLFPNPQKQADGSLQTNTTTYATAYYAAIDPANAKDTLDKWKAANGFGSGTGTETTVVFGDVKDLGYGRRMTARQNTDGTIAVMVENYLVSAAANYTYSSFNLDAAVVRDQRWHVGTNGIEFSPLPVRVRCSVRLRTAIRPSSSPSFTLSMRPPASANLLPISMAAATRRCPASASPVTAGAPIRSRRRHKNCPTGQPLFPLGRQLRFAEARRCAGAPATARSSTASTFRPRRAIPAPTRKPRSRRSTRWCCVAIRCLSWQLSDGLYRRRVPTPAVRH